MSTLKNRYFCKYKSRSKSPGSKSPGSKSPKSGSRSPRSELERIEFENPDYVKPKGVSANQKSPGYELFLASDKAYNIEESDTIELIKTSFSKRSDGWFKFVLFTVDDNPKLYIINGKDEINKHSVCYLYGLYEHITSRGQSPTRRYAVFIELMDVILRKKHEGVVLTENDPEIINFNKEIFKLVGCMNVIASGSATYMGRSGSKHHLCINTKSGHFLPTIEILQQAVSEYFPHYFPIDEWSIDIIKNVSDSELKKIYGEHYKDYTGTCFSEEELAALDVKKDKPAASASRGNRKAKGGTKKRKYTNKKRRRLC
jgi:hypothetical protein